MREVREYFLRFMYFRIGARKSNPSGQAQEALNVGRNAEVAAEENCFLRIHIPFPGTHGRDDPPETRSKDVVLFE